ncbi:hypothetical protein NA78x_005335 [Anatilimnocola sp. NA78]|uniref:hypothetical protein n=1 Tax=Anatilimnocola sp. NA78 TaxID=3415683 RepID=UPI003CE4FB3C
MRTLLVIALLTIAFAPMAEARGRQYSGGHVVHSRRGLVVLHRAVPGGGGVHVYGGR